MRGVQAIPSYQGTWWADPRLTVSWRRFFGLWFALLITTRCSPDFWTETTSSDSCNRPRPGLPPRDALRSRVRCCVIAG